MDPVSLGRIGPFARSAESAETSDTPATFGGMLRSALEQVEQAQRRADEETLRLVTGEASNLHDVVIAVEEAGILLSLVQQVRNRAVEAYQELMRTQI